MVRHELFSFRQHFWPSHYPDFLKQVSKTN